MHALYFYAVWILSVSPGYHALWLLPWSRGGGQSQGECHDRGRPQESLVRRSPVQVLALTLDPRVAGCSLPITTCTHTCICMHTHTHKHTHTHTHNTHAHAGAAKTGGPRQPQTSSSRTASQGHRGFQASYLGGWLARLSYRQNIL